MRQQSRLLNGLIGLGAVGSAVTGLLGFLLACISALSGNLLSAGVCLIAAALAFGLLLAVILRA